MKEFYESTRNRVARHAEYAIEGKRQGREAFYSVSVHEKKKNSYVH
jgi:hypothetical protein